jgi:TetR/AcrR family transcriptional regulator, tetracycline repressor protein
MALDREQVVRTALRVLNEVGLDKLTMRRIATELNVQAPALYWHFPSRQSLLDEMATTVFADLGRAWQPAAGHGWRELADQYGHALRAMLLSHRDGAKVFSGTYLTDASLYASMDAALRVFVDAGYSLRSAVTALSTIYNYTVGFAIEEQAVHPRPDQADHRYDRDARAARIDARAHPLAAAAGPELFEGFDARFDAGLELIVAGIAAAGESSSPRR